MTDTQWLLDLVEEATPGPWHVEGNSVLHSETGDDLYVVEEVAELASGARLPKDADARLMALAPDLARLCVEQHEALEEAQRILVYTRRDVMGMPDEQASGAERIVAAALARFAELKP